MKITYLAKLGELTLKGSNIKSFEQQLVRNTRDFLKHIPVDVILRAGRMYIEAEDEYSEKIEFCLSHLIGITGWARTETCEKNIEAITQTVTKLGLIAKENGAKTFKVDARRSDKSFPMDSYEIMRASASGLFDGRMASGVAAVPAHPYPDCKQFKRLDRHLPYSRRRRIPVLRLLPRRMAPGLVDIPVHTGFLHRRRPNQKGRQGEQKNQDYQNYRRKRRRD